VQVEIITEALQGSVVQLSTDSNGNHVIQQCLKLLPVSSCSFLFAELTAEATSISKHRHGYVLCTRPCGALVVPAFRV